jgi:MurNAc alpha-1-phosphate uridylyltransferase
MSEPLLPVALLAGGLSTRLRPLTDDQPKALLEVAGEPFIAHQLRALRSEGARDVIVCAGHLGEQIEAFVGDGRQFGLSVRFSYDGERLLGTAGALRNALPLLGEAFFVLYGDSLLTCRYPPIQEAFISSGKRGLMTVFENAGKWDTSNVQLRAGQIVAYSKRACTSAMRHIDYGLGALKADAVEDLVRELPCDLEWLYEELLAQNELAAYQVRERFYEIGSFAGLEETARYLEQRRAGVLR